MMKSAFISRTYSFVRFIYFSLFSSLDRLSMNCHKRAKARDYTEPDTLERGRHVPKCSPGFSRVRTVHTSVSSPHDLSFAAELAGKQSPPAVPMISAKRFLPNMS